jgi:hypothetical protein
MRRFRIRDEKVVRSNPATPTQQDRPRRRLILPLGDRPGVASKGRMMLNQREPCNVRDPAQSTDPKPHLLGQMNSAIRVTASPASRLSARERRWARASRHGSARIGHWHK